jgi:hypothetical protein
MIQQPGRTNDGAYMVLSTLYSLGCDHYDERVANQVILTDGSGPPLTAPANEED